MHQATNQETTKESFVTVPYIQGLSEEFRRIFKDTKVQIIFKGCNTLKTLLMHPKDKIPTQLYQDMVCQLTCPKENWQFFLHWRIKQMLGKQGQGKQYLIYLVQYFNIAQH